MKEIIELTPEDISEMPNPQLWENNPMRESSVDLDEKAAEGRFYNSKDPNFGIIREKPEHRLIILLKAQGHSNVEIARLTGYTNVWVGQVLRQPWAKLQLIEEFKRGGQDAVQALLQGSAVDSVYKLLELRDTAEDEGVQLRASQDLLDRHLGKATQRVEAHTTVHHTATEISEVDAQLAKLEAEERRLLGGGKEDGLGQDMKSPTSADGAPPVGANN